MMDRYYLGMDGGGTKTACVLICKKAGGERTEAGEIEIPGINYNSFRKEQITDAFAEIPGKICGLTGKIVKLSGIGIGAAGVSNPEAAPFLQSCVRKIGYDCPCIVKGDDEAALLGATEGAPGILLIAGTGSVCLALDTYGQKLRVGGWGHVIDDCGSAYAIGRDILSGIVHALDGRSEETVLTEMVMKQLGWQDIHDLVAYVYAAGTGKREIAAFSRFLEPALEQQDYVAEKIEGRAVNELVRLVTAAAQKIQKDTAQIPLILGGGVMKNNAHIRNAVIREIQLRVPFAEVSEPLHDAAYGAALFIERSDFDEDNSGD
ncbi:MAG: hypothetical protein LKF52_10845 [Butyrivibrio sp.]|nr:hypothetical protein [Butyrivibrio sp.]